MIIIDTETTGTNPQKHAILSIGAVEFSDPSNTFYGECAIWPGAEVLAESLPIHGFSMAEISDETKQTQYMLLDAFIDWLDSINDRTPAGIHVGAFDLQFLSQSAQRESLHWPLGKRSIDLHTLTVAHMWQHNPNYYHINNQRSDVSGTTIQQYCGLPEIPRPHNALTDAKWEAECFSRLLRGENLLPEFADDTIPKYLLVK